MQLAARFITFKPSELLFTGEGVFEMNNDRLGTCFDRVLKSLRAVVPKINGKSPTDCPWLVPNMECTSVDEIYMLIQSSFILQQKIENGCTVLELQQFVDINPKTEICVYIDIGKICGVCQKNMDMYCDYDESFLNLILQQLNNDEFLSSISNLNKTCLYLYMDGTTLKQIKSVEWDNLKLFTLEELTGTISFEFKYIESTSDIIPTSRLNYFPTDVKHLQNATEIVQILNDFQSKLV